MTLRTSKTVAIVGNMKSPKSVLCSSRFEFLEFQRAETILLKTESNKLIYVLNGHAEISYNQYDFISMSSADFILVPTSASLSIVASSSCKFVCFEFEYIKDSWINKRLESLTNVLGSVSYTYNKVKAKKALTLFFDNLLFFKSDLAKNDFIELKEKELFYILFSYYSNIDIYNIFYPVISNDVNFRSFVLANHLKVRGVAELAALSGHSLSTFKRRFFDNFGESVYSWMQMQKSKHIIHLFKNEKVVFSEIISTYGFSSPSHFTRFCKKYYGVTPSELRARITDEIFWESLSANNF